ncbi:unnamed protein product [Durusdinium trenchii]|uniref:PDZ domain-containing protein n=1 Tax=Durusdinium trenchii TaxID=1381693 RepID=A0ABP0HCC9_9DINO
MSSSLTRSWSDRSHCRIQKCWFPLRVCWDTGRLGMKLVEQDGVLVVRRTQKGTWADEMKLRIGDELVSINGQAVSQMMEQECRDTLLWRRPLRLTFARLCRASATPRLRNRLDQALQFSQSQLQDAPPRRPTTEVARSRAESVEVQGGLEEVEEKTVNTVVTQLWGNLQDGPAPPVPSCEQMEAETEDSQIEPPDISGPSHPPEQLPERSEVDTSLEEHDKVSAAPSSFAADYLDDDFENDDEFDEESAEQVDAHEQGGYPSSGERTATAGHLEQKEKTKQMEAEDSQIEPPDNSGPSHPPEQLPERSEVDTSLEEHDKVSAAPSSFAADYLDDDFENDDEFNEESAEQVDAHEQGGYPSSGERTATAGHLEQKDSQIEPPDNSGPSHPPEQLPERSEADASSVAPSSFLPDYLEDDFENDDEFDEESAEPQFARHQDVFQDSQGKVDDKKAQVSDRKVVFADEQLSRSQNLGLRGREIDENPPEPDIEEIQAHPAFARQVSFSSDVGEDSNKAKMRKGTAFVRADSLPESEEDDEEAPAAASERKVSFSHEAGVDSETARAIRRGTGFVATENLPESEDEEDEAPAAASERKVSFSHAGFTRRL